MIIIETQADGTTREYEIPDRLENTATEFFEWLLENAIEPEIVKFEIKKN
jgi:hypothetical protein